jgi:anthranilate phosphoribosyltransferase
MQTAELSSLAVADAEASLAMINAVFAGVKGPASDIVALNAGAAIYAAGLTDSLADGVALAAATISSGKAKQTFQALIETSCSV